MSDNVLAIELANVHKEYSGSIALRGIDLKVRQGSIHGFLGPNGAGKSTAMNIIAGLIPPSQGSVQVLGRDALNHIDFVKNAIGMLPEHPPLYLNMTVRDYLVFSQSIHGMRDENHLKMIIERIGLDEVEKRLIGNLSKGYRQRVGMAQALSYNADIIILDEPMVGLDPQAITKMRGLILELKKDHTILLSTHQLYEAAKICDDVTIIQQGTIRKTGSLKDIEHELLGAKRFISYLSQADEQLVPKLKEIKAIQNVSVENLSQGCLQIEMQVRSDEDIRGELTQLMVQHGTLLEFKESKLDLEDVFEQVVSNG